MNEALSLWLMVPEVPDEPLTLEEFLKRPAWHRQAACRGMGTDAFFPGLGGSSDAAKAVCEGCQVRVECLQAAMASPETQAIWGGLGDKGRRELRKAVA